MADSKQQPGRPVTKPGREPHALKIDRELWQELTDAAKAADKSRSDIVEQALRQYLKGGK